MMEINLNRLSNTLFSQLSAAPIAIYRIGFGLLMFISTIRFISNGWVESQYLTPTFHFRFELFESLPYPSEIGIWCLFIAMLISAFLITVGLFYRFATILFFLSFTYVEILDKTNYLNHYYFVSLIAFLLIFIPANRYFSLDARLGFTKPSSTCSLWEIRILQFQIAIVYFYAGLAKINYDWLIQAQPLKYWLHTTNHWAIWGDLLKQNWVAYLFSWFGAFYDLFIVVFLIIPKTRPIAYSIVVIFHLVTWILFPIGVFPWVMIVATLIFFNATFHERILQVIRTFFKLKPIKYNSVKKKKNKLILLLIGTYMTFQIVFPLRYLAYEGPIFWTESGYRFSWRVMLMEKTGYATFFVMEGDDEMEINNSDFLTPNQEKMMSTQPDMILQYAHFLSQTFSDTSISKFGHQFQFNQPEVHAEVFVTLNSRPHQLYVNKNLDLTTIKLSDKRNWLEPFKDE